VKYLVKTLNAKNLTFGYKLGDGTSGKVYLATNNQQRSFAVKQIKMKMQKVLVAQSTTKHYSQKPMQPDRMESLESSAVVQVKKRKKQVRYVYQKDYLREPFINKYLIVGPQMYHPNIVAMRNFYLDKGTKSGKGRLNLVLDYVKFGDLSIVTSTVNHISF
jgi:serine/threonine protein kinase